MIVSTRIKKRDSLAHVVRSYATGRRKTSSARVWLQRGSGKITVNGRDIVQYFARGALRCVVEQPFVVTSSVRKYDVLCTVRGGGLSGQAGAVKLGIGRAIDSMEKDGQLHVLLRKAGILTRDPRAVERKKYGRKKARKSFQFSKR